MRHEKSIVAPARRKGQIVLVLAAMLAALLILVLMNVDVFIAARSKNRLTDAGDAAALAAARWQGLTLNLIGQLNLAHIETACRYAESPDISSNLCAGIAALQERIAFAGPLMGCYDANRAARLNGIGEFEETRTLVTEVIARAQLVPPTETWPDKPSDYALMVQAAFSEGAAAGVDNANLYNLDFSGDHPLYNKSFYYAIEGEDWCWFFFSDEYMDRLRSFTGWGDLPPARLRGGYFNPEFLGCAVRPRSGQAFVFLRDITDIMLDLAGRHGLGSVNPDSIARGIFGLPVDEEGHRHPCALNHDWWFYDTTEWRTWTEMDVYDNDHLPLVSEVKEEYDIFGASSAMRTFEWIAPVTPGVYSNLNYWTGAAKPFGLRDTPYGKCTVTQYDPTPDQRPFPLVTPDFTDVRLIPLAGASETRLGTSDLEWVRHTRDHVPDCAHGHIFGNCRYCTALKKWNDPKFRRRGVDWLAENSGQCRYPTVSGTIRAGGTRHAH